MKVALVHDYLVDRGGAERFLLHMHELFPDAPIFTSIHRPETTFPEFSELDVRTSFMQGLRVGKRGYKRLLPLYPLAFESFDLSAYDVVLSQTTSFAKGVLTRPGTCHICYCNTPTRFIWRHADYVDQEAMGRVARGGLLLMLGRLRQWDYLAAQRVDRFLANSANTAARIRKFYRRDSDVMHGPVETSRFSPAVGERGNYFLCLSRLAPYKRLDIAIEAFNRLGQRLVIAGAGDDLERLRRLAGPTIEFVGEKQGEELNRTYGQARAFILPGEEDFGITPLEANAAGTPVIANAAGGALETVIPGRTGEHFAPQSVEALMDAVTSFDPARYRREDLVAHARAFDAANFRERLGGFVDRALAQHRRPRAVSE